MQYRSLLALPMLLLVGPAVAGTPSYSYVEAGAYWARPEWNDFGSHRSVALRGSAALTGGWHAFGRYSDPQIRISGAGRGRIARDWLVAGVGYVWPISDGFHLVAGATAQRVELGGEPETGYGLQTGVRMRLARLEFATELGTLNLGWRDVSIAAEALVYLTDKLSITSHIRDFDDWDYTSYEAGLRYHF